MSRPVKGWVMIAILTIVILALIGMAVFYMAKTCVSYVEGYPNWAVVLFAALTSVFVFLGLACVRTIYKILMFLQLDSLTKKWGEAIEYAEQTMDEDPASAVAAVEEGKLLRQKCNQIWHKLGKGPL